MKNVGGEGSGLQVGKERMCAPHLVWPTLSALNIERKCAHYNMRGQHQTGSCDQHHVRDEKLANILMGCRNAERVGFLPSPTVFVVFVWE